MHTRLLSVLVLLSLAGCGSNPKYAPVSGRITLGGKPLVNAFVMFQPIPPEGSALAAAPGSSGKTNANGEYTLTISNGEAGAWVGKHTVMIELHAAKSEVNGDARPRAGRPQINTIPAKYNSSTTLTFDVPANGSTQADFDLDLK